MVLLLERGGGCCISQLSNSNNEVGITLHGSIVCVLAGGCAFLAVASRSSFGNVQNLYVWRNQYKGSFLLSCNKFEMSFKSKLLSCRKLSTVLSRLGHTVVNLLTLYVRLCSTLFSERELDVNLREVHFFAIMVGWV